MRPEIVAQRGFAIVSALFLMVALAALGAGILHFSSIQQVTGALDIQGARALGAARAGSEWMVAQVNTASACPAAGIPTSLNGFDLTLSCDPGSSSFTDEGVSLRIYTITSRASAGGAVGNLGYVEREIRTVVAK